MSEAETLTTTEAIRQAPKMSTSGLSKVLAVMCLVPVATIASIFTYMPPVEEGKLEASVAAEGLPPGAFYYQNDRGNKAAAKDAVLVVTNDSDQDWTHLNIQINKFYQIYSKDPIPAKQTRRFRLDRFIMRNGGKFDASINPLKKIRIYARRPTKDRATFVTDFDWESIGAAPAELEN